MQGFFQGIQALYLDVTRLFLFFYVFMQYYSYITEYIYFSYVSYDNM